MIKWKKYRKEIYLELIYIYSKMVHISENYHHHKHFKKQSKSKKTVYICLFFTLFFALVELIGGILSNSLALVGDSFHMFSDVVALLSSMIAIYYSSKKPNDKFTYGYLRLEIIVAFLNGIALMLISIYIFIEGIHRFITPREIDVKSMFSISMLGLFVNIVITMVLVISLKKENNLNIKSAMLHFFGDLLNSIGVIFASVVIYYTKLNILDPIISLVIGSIIFYGGYKITKEAFYILMEATPIDVDIEKLKKDILSVEEIKGLHEFHIWKTDSEEISVTFHILLENYNDYDKNNNYILLNKINEILKEKYGIFHSTIQIENLEINEHL